MQRPQIQYVAPLDAPPWPPAARTMAEAFDMMRPPPKHMTRAELAKLYPPKE